MKLESSAHRIQKSLSIKKFLLGLNKDLDRILGKIESKSIDQAVYCHSHFLTPSRLSNVQIAILLLEDRRFFSHAGVEFRGFLRAIKRLIGGHRLGGVSTIDQQIVRIYTNRYERTAKRKFKEIMLAYVLNFHCSKSEILYAYIHDSYFGYRLEGCEMVARFLFSKNADSLNSDEAAFIASLLARPLPKSVYSQVIFQGNRVYSPKEIITIGKSVAPSWAGHVERRFQYALRLLESIESNLRIR